MPYLPADGSITIFIAFNESCFNPILSWLFKKFAAPPVHTFAIDNDFTFVLVNSNDAARDLFHYRVSFGDVTLQVSLMGIETSELCEPPSNLDVVYFVWENFIRFSFKKYAIAQTPRDPPAHPELVFLKQYRTESDGWKDSGKCPECIEHIREALLPFHGCDLSYECGCKVCTR